MSAPVQTNLRVDRIEEKFAVLEWNGLFLDIPLSLLPNKTTEGMQISMNTSIVPTHTDEAKNRLERLKEKFPKQKKIKL